MGASNFYNVGFGTTAYEAFTKCVEKHTMGTWSRWIYRHDCRENQFCIFSYPDGMTTDEYIRQRLRMTRKKSPKSHRYTMINGVLLFVSDYPDYKGHIPNGKKAYYFIGYASD